MEALAVPWFVLVRYLGPPLFLLVVGGALLLWRPPRRRVLAWTALGTNLLAAALPFLWITVQRATDAGDLTVIGLVMTFLQPGLVVLAWLALLWALVDPRSREQRSPGAAPGQGEDRVTENVG